LSPDYQPEFRLRWRNVNQIYTKNPEYPACTQHGSKAMGDASLTSTRPTKRFAELRRMAKRFPVTLACAVLLASVLATLYYGNVNEIPLFVYNVHLIVSLIVGMGFGIPATVAAALFSEDREWAARYRHLFAAGALVVCVPLAAVVAKTDFPLMSTFFSLVTLVFLAPALKRGRTDKAVWSRVYGICAVFGHSFLVAAIVAITATGGIRILDGLFDLNIPKELVPGIWGFCLLVVWPVKALIRIPDLAGLPADDRGPAWFQALLNWLVAPLALITVALLLLFAGYTAIEWELPGRARLEIFAIVTILCVFAWLSVYPLRMDGSTLLRIYHRYFPWILALLALILLVFPFLRIAEIGVNERNAYVVLIAVWSAGIGMYLLIARTPKVIVPPLSIAIVLLAAAPGPWTAEKIAYEVKLGKFESLMADNGFLVDGRLVPNDANLDESTERDLFVMAWELYDNGNSRAFASWLAEAGATIDEDREIEAVLNGLGIDYVESEAEKAEFYFSSQRDEWQEGFSYHGPVDVAGFDVVTELRLNGYGSRASPFVVSGAREDFQVSFVGVAITVASLADTEKTVVLDITPLITRLRANTDPEAWSVPADRMAIETRGNELKVRFSANTLEGKQPGTKVHDLGGGGFLMIGRE
jgi:hypothetical protein